MSNLFTDNNLKVFYNNLLTHYKGCMTRNLRPSLTEVYNEMYLATQYTVDSPNGQLFHLDQTEKVKVYQAFHSIFYSLPYYRDTAQVNMPKFARPKFSVVIKYQPPHYYRNSFNDTLLTWMLLSSMTHSCSFNHHGAGLPGNVHSNPNSGSSSDSSGNAVAALVIILLVAAAAALAIIALCYMIHQAANSIERFVYNEGWLKAALMLATSIGFGVASTVFSLTVASGPLIALAIAAGFNPVGILVVGAVCLTLMGAGLATLMTSLVYDFIENKSHSKSMDPSDPLRYRLTESEETNLIQKGFDPAIVKVAIVALRAEIAKEMDSDSATPSFFSRHFGSGRNVQHLLDKVRDLRSAELADDIIIGDLRFNCRVPAMHYRLPPEQAYAQHVQNQVPDGYEVPSAPAWEPEVQLYK